jgi:tartrate-resistant acid phosphatase type 5
MRNPTTIVLSSPAVAILVFKKTRKTLKNTLIKIILLWLLTPIPAVAQPLFAIIGDLGADSTDASTLAGLVYGWNPEFIITTGDNRYSGISYDEVFGRYYCDFMAESGNGVYCSGVNSLTNRLFPSLGNHDYDEAGGLDEYLNYLNLPGSGVNTSNTSGNERYYDFIRGSVHFFVIDSEGAVNSSSD